MTAKSTFGATLKIGTAGGAVSAVANLVNFTPPEWTVDAVDITTHDSAGGAMEYMPDGVHDTGEIPFEGNFIAGSTDDDRLQAAVAGKTLLDWEIELYAATGTKTMSGSNGFLTKLAIGELVVKGGKQTFSGAIKVSGPIVFEA